jgi:hypothetical protein
MTRRLFPAVLLLLGLALFTATSPAGQDPPEKTMLLNVSKGQLPNDTGMDDKTIPEIVNEFKELGGAALKVPYAKSDSFGTKNVPTKNWKPFVAVRFDAFNPTKEEVSLAMNIFHGRTTNYQTRVVVPILLKPGRNEVKLPISDMASVNGSAPDMTNVTRWFIHDAKDAAPTLYFGDIWLEAEGSPAAPVGSQAAIGYRVKGTIGAMDVDLTVTPIFASGSGGAPAPTAAPTVHGDPARLSRIKAAKMPAITKPVAFDTPEADAIVSALEIFPPDNPWNLDVSEWPLHPNSKKIVDSIGANKPFRYNPDMGYVLVPSDQKKVDVKIVAYSGESDKGPFPVPDIIPIEGWPANYKGKKVTLDDVQRDVLKEDGDRHAVVVDPVKRMIYEFYQLKKTDNGWQAAQSSVFDLKSNKMRPDEWTSTDAAGLPIFPSVVRYDELKRGMVDHAMRVTVVNTRRAYVYPARHFASSKTDVNLPRMGERLRLRQNFDISGFSPEVQAILKGLKKYGMLVADNGIDWAISVAPDPRIADLHAEIRKLKGSDFEVVEAPKGYKPPAE